MHAGRYDTLAIVLHWTMALLILLTMGVGFWMSDLKPSPDTIKIYNWHKWFGLSVLALAVVRLIWRATHRPPPLPAHTPRWQRLAASGGHWGLYGLMLAMPLSGWLQNSASGFPLSWFGLFKVPALIARDRQAFEFWQDVHEMLAITLAALIALHLAAALKHHFVDRDGLLWRMWPRRKPAVEEA